MQIHSHEIRFMIIVHQAGKLIIIHLSLGHNLNDDTKHVSALLVAASELPGTVNSVGFVCHGVQVFLIGVLTCAVLCLPFHVFCLYFKKKVN